MNKPWNKLALRALDNFYQSYRISRYDINEQFQFLIEYYPDEKINLSCDDNWTQLDRIISTVLLLEYKYLEDTGLLTLSINVPNKVKNDYSNAHITQRDFYDLNLFT